MISLHQGELEKLYNHILPFVGHSISLNSITDSIKLIKPKDGTLETYGLYKVSLSPAKASQGLQLTTKVISIVMKIVPPPCGI